MTTRWVKGSEHLVLVVEGETSNVNVFKSALEIDMDANIVIDISAMNVLDEGSLKFLNNFAVVHKAKHFSLFAVTKNKVAGLTKIEIIPTVTEARELIFMEITERELGFFGEDEVVK